MGFGPRWKVEGNALESTTRKFFLPRGSMLPVPASKTPVMESLTERTRSATLQRGENSDAYLVSDRGDERTPFVLRSE